MQRTATTKESDKRNERMSDKPLERETEEIVFSQGKEPKKGKKNTKARAGKKGKKKKRNN